MKTPEPPPSSKGQGKDEESVPGDTPMARFRSLTKRLANVDPKKVRALEARERRSRAKKRDD